MRFKWTREAFIPQHPTAVIRNKAQTAVVYLADCTNGRPVAVAFYGKQAKPAINCQYRSPERRALAIAEWFASIDKTEAYKAERRAKRKAFRHTLKVGDVLRSSWGYDQTNIDYYEVVAVVGAMVDVRPIGAESVDTAYMQGNCVPAPGHYTGPAKRYRPAEGNAVKVRSHCHAYPMEYREIAGTRVYSSSSWTAYA